MKEYEYTFEVKSLEPFKKYCDNEHYELIEQGAQNRTIYRKNDGTMARITINNNNGQITKCLDFKEDKLVDQPLVERRESESLYFSDEKAVYSILEFLGYKKDNVLIRNRYTYKKGDEKFEMDEYIEPRKAYIVAIEGKKEKVDSLYDEVKNLQ